MFGKGEELVVLQVILTFDVSDGGKSPTRSALLLVLDVGDGTFFTPIIRIGSGITTEDDSTGIVVSESLRSDLVGGERWRGNLGFEIRIIRKVNVDLDFYLM